MTTNRLQRCGHCGVTYAYITSGHGCLESANDSRYCPDCAGVVLQALAKVPRKFERVWAPTTEVTLEELLRIERADTSLIRRVSMPLYDTSTWESDRSGFVRREGVEYNYRFWPGRESEAVITREMEKNLETGELRPWVGLPQ